MAIELISLTTKEFNWFITKRIYLKRPAPPILIFSQQCAVGVWVFRVIGWSLFWQKIILLIPRQEALWTDGLQVTTCLMRHAPHSLCGVLRIADSVQTEYCPTFPLSVRASVTGVTSHISHIYKGINAMLIIRGPIKPYTVLIKIILAIFLAKIRPDKTIFSALTNLTIDFDFKLSKV